MALLTSAVSGCATDGDVVYLDYGIDVDAVYDSTKDFTEYRTFAFRQDSELSDGLLADLDEDVRDDLRQANDRMAAELEDLGLEQVAADEADVLAFSLARSSDRARLTWTCVPGVWDGYWYWGYYYDPCAWLDPVYVDVDRTTIVAGLVDPESESVVFAGFIHGIDEFGDVRDREISIGVARLFARYPAAPPADDAGDGMTDAGDGMTDAGDGMTDAGDGMTDAG